MRILNLLLSGTAVIMTAPLIVTYSLLAIVQTTVLLLLQRISKKSAHTYESVLFSSVSPASWLTRKFWKG